MHITAERGLALLHAAVALKGADHVQQRCRYAPATADREDGGVDREPGCIVGTALFIAGVSLDTLADCEGILAPDTSNPFSRGNEKFADAGITFTPSALRLFGVAQALQDGRGYDLPADMPDLREQVAGKKQTWGDALALTIQHA